MRSVVTALLLIPGLAIAGPGHAFAGQDNSARLAMQFSPEPISSIRPLQPQRIAPVPVSVRPGSLKPRGLRSTVLDPAGQCEAAVDDAENDEHVPPRLLAAISLTETGRHDPVSGTYRPWPYSINAEGQGQFFGSAKEAIAAVRDLQARGVQSIDVGCLQVNLMYHPRAFASLEDAFDPRKNALYAAQFLVSLYTVSKDWMQAAGAYHSQTPGFADPYRQQVAARWKSPTLANQTPPKIQYRDFGSVVQVYGDFAGTRRVYGAFTTGTAYR
jgi:hypothetical protein